MYDTGKIIPGLLVFVGLVTFPIWYGFVSADGHLPNPEKPTKAKQCVESTEFMRTSHMVLLNDWRDNIVREGGSRHGKTADGTEFVRSLHKGCMDCHTSKRKFCDECHTYAAVKPYCWDCHIQPKEAN
ncbi:MAG: sulfate reduction electron transfer complex DsrMKJOP subunit DsrJ [Desulfurivibrionaceae bacterium]|nr:sulfate reduction electron transfer complex DsrMKJOP subunit DsrJ [Desulfobulbales bacterium]MDT8334430.1 sulfate reduction electron transfer complex DsrMKJOP subunit DsrJ [Desulfurivibrionaceae bacterium]